MKRALVFSLVCVLGLSFAGLAQTLSGSWDTDITIDPQKTSFVDALALTSVLKVNYGIGDWTFGSVTALSENGWTDQDFSATGVLGAFSITSALDLNPNATFGDWTTTAKVSIAGVSFSGTFKLDGTDAYLTLTGKGGIGTPVVVDVKVEFGDPTALSGCDLDFQAITIGVDFTFCDCAPIESEIKFDCEGLAYIKFVTKGIAIPNLPWVTIGATLQYTLQTKTLVLTPTFDFGAITCFDLYFDVDTTGGNLTFNSITIYGIGIECTIGGVEFGALSQWGTGPKTGLLKGTEYWEVYWIGTDDDGCCGPFEFDLAVFFKDKGTKLFDIALVQATMELQIASQFTFNTGLKINVETGAFTEWVIGFLVTW